MKSFKSTLKVTTEGLHFSGQVKPQHIADHVFKMMDTFNVDVMNVEPKELVVDVVLSEDLTLAFEPSLQVDEIPTFVYAMISLLAQIEEGTKGVGV